MNPLESSAGWAEPTSAARMGRTYLSGVERSERNVSVDNIAGIAKRLRIDPWKLLRDECPGSSTPPDTRADCIAATRIFDRQKPSNQYGSGVIIKYRLKLARLRKKCCQLVRNVTPNCFYLCRLASVAKHPKKKLV
jgi:transcriptional regulator with XRE-family HTH domain